MESAQGFEQTDGSDHSSVNDQEGGSTGRG